MSLYPDLTRIHKTKVDEAANTEGVDMDKYTKRYTGKASKELRDRLKNIVAVLKVDKLAASKKIDNYKNPKIDDEKFVALLFAEARIEKTLISIYNRMNEDEDHYDSYVSDESSYKLAVKMVKVIKGYLYDGVTLPSDQVAGLMTSLQSDSLRGQGVSHRFSP